MIVNELTRDNYTSSIGDAKIFCSISSDSCPFGSLANTLRSSVGGAAAGAIDAACGAIDADAIFIFAASQPAATITHATKANAVFIMAKDTRGSRVAYMAAVSAVESADFAV